MQHFNGKVHAMELCQFRRFHNHESEKFDKSFVYGDIRVGVLFYHVRGEFYYCVDISNILIPNSQSVHMECDAFDRCIKLLTQLTRTNIFKPKCAYDDLHVKQVPMTQTYKIVYNERKVIVDMCLIDGLLKLWAHLQFFRDEDL